MVEVEAAQCAGYSSIPIKHNHPSSMFLARMHKTRLHTTRFMRSFILATRMYVEVRTLARMVKHHIRARVKVMVMRMEKEITIITRMHIPNSSNSNRLLSPQPPPLQQQLQDTILSLCLMVHLSQFHQAHLLHLQG